MEVVEGAEEEVGVMIVGMYIVVVPEDKDPAIVESGRRLLGTVQVRIYEEGEQHTVDYELSLIASIELSDKR